MSGTLGPGGTGVDAGLEEGVVGGVGPVGGEVCSGLQFSVFLRVIVSRPRSMPTEALARGGGEDGRGAEGGEFGLCGRLPARAGVRRLLTPPHSPPLPSYPS